jgi:hypothetical protein
MAAPAEAHVRAMRYQSAFKQLQFAMFLSARLTNQHSVEAGSNLNRQLLHSVGAEIVENRQTSTGVHA